MTTPATLDLKALAEKLLEKLSRPGWNTAISYDWKRQAILTTLEQVAQQAAVVRNYCMRHPDLLNVFCSECVEEHTKAAAIRAGGEKP